LTLRLPAMDDNVAFIFARVTEASDPAGPVGPVAPIGPAAPVAPLGIVKLNVAADELPEFVAEAFVPGDHVVVALTAIVAAAPAAP
jgi:hypothetical protein